METVHILRIHARHLAHAAIQQVHQPQIGILVPNGEVPVSVTGETEPAAIRRNAREGDTLILRRSVIDALQFFSEAHILRVEGNPVQAVFGSLILLGHGRHGLCRAEIEPFPVRREGREGLETVGRLGQRRPGNLVCMNIIHDHIRGLVVHFNPVGVMTMEHLKGLVHGKSDIIPRRMPVWIDQGTEGGIGLGIQFLNGAFVHQQGAAERGTGMENHLFRISVAVGVAIHAVPAGQPVFNNGPLGITRQLTLVQAHHLPALVAGRNKPVRYPRIHLVPRNVHGKGLIGKPFPVAANLYGQLQRIGRHLRAPQAFRDDETAVFPLEATVPHQQAAGFVSQIREIQRSDVAGNRHAGIIRPNRRQALQRSVGTGTPSAGEAQGQHRQDNYFSHISV